MNNKKIEENLFQAIEASKPDQLAKILADSKKQKRNVVVIEQPQERNSFIPKLAFALAFVFAIITGGILYNNSQLNRISTTLFLDVNPSVEINLNKDDRVVNVEPLNEDGKTIIGTMDFRNSDLEVTVNALIGSMLRNGYLSDIKNSILVSVENNDQAKAEALQKQLSEEIDKLLKGDNMDGAVITQSISDDPETAKMAKEYNISRGKARYIQKIINNTTHSFDELAKLNINDLNLISKDTDTVTNTGTPSDKGYIGKEKAIQIAYEKVKEYFPDAMLASGSENPDEYPAVYNLPASTFTAEVEMDYEKGIMVYEVEFKGYNFEHEVEVNALTGEVVDISISVDKTPVGLGNYIGSTKVMQIISDNSGIPVTGMHNFAMEAKRYNDTVVYEIEFDYNGIDHEYVINATTGEIINHEIDEEDDDDTETAMATAISEDQAVNIALNHAGLSRSQVSELKVEKEWENSKIIYEIDFKAGEYEYDYTISASDGAIINAEKELDD